MRIIINKDKCWIKDDVVLPSNFYSMRDNEKWNYIYENNLLHRENGPTIIFSGIEYWYLNGKIHREDGPAVIYPDGAQEWWLNNIEVDEKIYKKIEESSKEELLMYAVLPKYKDYIPLIEYRLI